MQGIYSRDQMANLLQTAIENANARRQATVDRQNSRTASNSAAAQDFLKSLGRTIEQKSAEKKEADRRKELENIQRLEAELENAKKMERSAKALQLRRESRSKEEADKMSGYRPAPSMEGYSRYLDTEWEDANSRADALASQLRRERLSTEASGNMYGYRPTLDKGAMNASYDMAMAIAEAQRKGGLY